MKRALLLIAGSTVAICAAGAPIPVQSGVLPRHAAARGTAILYTQNSNYAGAGINSQNFTDGSFGPLSDQAADDFVVPSGYVWKIKEVDVSGQYGNSTAQASSENITFYHDHNGQPGKPVTNGTFQNLAGIDSNGNFAIALPFKLKLKPGKYWVSVIINLGFYQQGDEWLWNETNVGHGRQAMWQNPDGGWGFCQTWCTLGSLGSKGTDLMFELKGTTNIQAARAVVVPR